jgi:hypothetical protein
MSDAVIAALIAASAIVIGSVLTYLAGILCPSVREDLQRSPARFARRVKVRSRGAAAGRDGAIDRRRAGVARLPRGKEASAPLGAACPLAAKRTSRVHVTSASTSTP